MPARILRWLFSQETARRNAMEAAEEGLLRRREREEVGDFLHGRGVLEPKVE